MVNILKQFFGGGMPEISIDDYIKDYEKENHLLIDVRTTGEFKTGHLPKAKSIPLNELENALESIPKDKPVILVCWSGSRSASATRLLAKAGYENVYNLKGGTMFWQMQGKPLKK
jgi:rhodanese-related sulfurtransferase